MKNIIAFIVVGLLVINIPCQPATHGWQSVYLTQPRVYCLRALAAREKEDVSFVYIDPELDVDLVKQKEVLKKWIMEWKEAYAFHGSLRISWFRETFNTKIILHDVDLSPLAYITYLVTDGTLQIQSQYTKDSSRRTRLISLLTIFLIYATHSAEVHYNSLTREGYYFVTGMERNGIWEWWKVSHCAKVNVPFIRLLVTDDSAFERFIKRESIEVNMHIALESCI